MLKAINQARDLAVDGPEKVAEKERLAEQAEQARASRAGRPSQQVEQAEVPKQEADDVAGKQDT